MYIINSSMTKVTQMYNGEKIVSSINGAEKTKQQHAKESGSFSYTIHKNYLRTLNSYLNVRPETIKTLEETIDISPLSSLTSVLTIFFWMRLQSQGKQKQMNGTTSN